MVLDSVLYPCHEVLEVVLHLRGDVVRVKTAFMGITDDRRFAVDGGHDDETVRGVENEEGGNFVFRSIGGCKLQFFGSHELGSDGLGCCLINGGCHRTKIEPEYGNAE